MAIVLEGVPALIDLQVLSPIAWVKRENERQGLDVVNVAGPRTLLHYLKQQADIIEMILDESAGGVLTEEQFRAIDWNLIQSASLATRWMESLRERYAETQRTQEPTHG